ncbi:MAG: LAGLIDADG homing endonuclease [Candidatus Amesbacteria bacterium GW2011_GWA2_42_12]|uniref:LAGLIDADG homing endonuclease n=1 Tax=Candidatus Amesbacteria bacterium GW2011_GWA2_42_12 TaxID=1618356 RepID=A0A0G0Y5W3_9BACT|nr:MAG: LAGLIDADG homing endonuclease [Candidatus Amesbacteria bacterium GW2011_GWA2_42_12]
MGIPREPFDFAQGKPLGHRRDYTRAPLISKSYLMGLIHDATKRKTTIRIAQKNESYLRFISEEMKLLGINSWIYKEGKTRSVWILEFSKKHLENVKIKSKTEKIDYLRGYFDAEGGIAKASSVRFYLYYCQKNYSEMVLIRNWLTEFKINCGKIHNPSRDRDPDFWRFYISASGYSKFAKLIGSSHPDKWPYLRMKI